MKAVEKNSKSVNKSIKEYVESVEKSDLNYIEVYENYIPKDLCDYLIEKFKELRNRGYGMKGSTAYETSLEIKNSEDIYIGHYFGKILDDWNEKHSLFEKYLRVPIVDYMIAYGLFGVEHLGKGIKQYLDEGHDVKVMGENFNYQNYCIRKYEKNIGHFKAMHADCGKDTITRVVAVIVYLNDVEKGGETIFPLLGKKIKPKAGSILIFPSYFTHYHMASIPLSDDKYCVCIHVNFKQQERGENGKSDRDGKQA